MIRGFYIAGPQWQDVLTHYPPDLVLIPRGKADLRLRCPPARMDSNLQRPGIHYVRACRLCSAWIASSLST